MEKNSNKMYPRYNETFCQALGTALYRVPLYAGKFRIRLTGVLHQYLCHGMEKATLKLFEQFFFIHVTWKEHFRRPFQSFRKSGKMLSFWRSRHIRTRHVLQKF